MNLYNHNANINYPFVDDIELPFNNAVILDSRIQIEARQGLASVPVTVVTALTRTGTSFSVTLKIDGVPHTYTTASAALGAGGYTVFQLSDLTTRFMLVLGPAAYEGSTTVISDVDGYQLRPDTVIDVSQFELTGLLVGTESMIGDIVITEGRNAKVASKANALTIGLAVNAGDYACDGTGVSDCGTFLRFLNGAGPDNAGSVNIVGGAGIKVTNYPASNAVDIMAIPEDECAV